MEKDQKETSNKPSTWFFAEWISLMGTVLVCFIFLFYQIQSLNTHLQASLLNQTMRTDRLYEMFYEIVKERK